MYKRHVRPGHHVSRSGPTNREPLFIAVVGVGTAGPAVAAFLARAGHRVVLLERAPECKPVGAGLLLQPTGWHVIERLGVADRLGPLVAPVSRLHCEVHGRHTLFSLAYADLCPGIEGKGTHRPTLLDALLTATTQSGAEVRWGCAVQSLERTSDGRPVLHTAAGERLGPFDLVLVCDGSQSTLRAQCGLRARATRYPWGALWCMAPRTPDFAPDVLWQCVDTSRRLAGFLPTGTQRDLLSMFWSIRLSEVDAWKSRPLGEWKSQVLRMVPRAEGLLSGVTEHAQLAVATYQDVRMARWHGDRVALLGDAAHALSPQLGQGANLALMDAAALADALAHHCESDAPAPQVIGAALQDYTRARRKHVLFYQFATRWLTPFFQSSALPLGWMRDWTFPLSQRIPWMRHQMAATLAGIKTGPFSELPVPRG